jgi:hypothetical protein
MQSIQSIILHIYNLERVKESKYGLNANKVRRDTIDFWKKELAIRVERNHLINKKNEKKF